MLILLDCNQVNMVEDIQYDTLQLDFNTKETKNTEMTDHIDQLIQLFHCDGESVHCPSQVHSVVLDMVMLEEAEHHP